MLLPPFSAFPTMFQNTSISSFSHNVFNLHLFVYLSTCLSVFRKWIHVYLNELFSIFPPIVWKKVLDKLMSASLCRAEDNMVTRYLEGRSFAYHLGTNLLWGSHSSNCNEAVVILYSKKDFVVGLHCLVISFCFLFPPLNLCIIFRIPDHFKLQKWERLLACSGWYQDETA